MPPFIQSLCSPAMNRGTANIDPTLAPCACVKGRCQRTSGIAFCDGHTLGTHKSIAR